MHMLSTVCLFFLCCHFSYAGRHWLPSDEEVDMAYACLNMAFPTTRSPIQIVSRIDSAIFDPREDKTTLEFLAADSTCTPEMLAEGIDQRSCEEVGDSTLGNYKYFTCTVRKTQQGYQPTGNFRPARQNDMLEIDG
uniref:Cystatin domain-containing protein n=1 Tax=Trichuris muris TaxID=70415 RepID=A0A5S6QKC4_TRIMR